MRTIDWIAGDAGGGGGHIRLIDQTRLPANTVQLDIDVIEDLIAAIVRLSVRGAPALGVAGALGVALAAQNLPAGEVAEAAGRLRIARPTAVNLAAGVDRVLHTYRAAGSAAALREALAVRDEEIASCLAMSAIGADLVRELTGTAPVTVMTICNTGALAAVEHGTALGVVEKLHNDGHLTTAIALETRPLLQGARLTAWELDRLGIDYQLIVDSAAAAVLAGGGIDAVLVGADRIAANGDVANKIGTFALALAANYAKVPFLVVAPETTIDTGTARGTDIAIEDRDPAEVCSFAGVSVAPAGASARNPAFDVTPAALITAIVTERQVIRLDAPTVRDHPVLSEVAQRPRAAQLGS
ncbi:MAG: S-methyl-5-thioribose-1-phosphate isomerase [Actinomycetota bacterium]|nr:S-methyl-5-thioribose-1-phosphate isomerase [Actinomycetota bacterium]